MDKKKLVEELKEWGCGTPVLRTVKLGAELRKMRLDCGMLIKNVVSILNISHQTLYRIERGKTCIRPERENALKRLYRLKMREKLETEEAIEEESLVREMKGKKK